MGDAVTQFSLVIGVFLSSMGIGSYLVQYISRRLVYYFVCIEMCIALIGGLSSLVMFATGAYLPEAFSLVFYGICILIGSMVGAEIPLLIRILKENEDVEHALSNVLALDYIGALIGSLLFPFLILPYVGLSRASVLFGLLNLIVAWLGIALLKKRERRQIRIPMVAIALILIGSFFYSQRWVQFFEDVLYQDEIVYAEETPYQRIIVTRWRDDVRLFLNGHIQFSSVDEFRYHEPLVHTAVSALSGPVQKVLILGGGDGLAARELFKYSSIQDIDLVDIDPGITKLAQNNPYIRSLNQDALKDTRVNIHHTDGMQFLQETSERYDVIIIDLPDPNAPPLSKLYSTAFYTLILRRLNINGVFITQASSPYFAPEAFWCVANTIEATFRESPIISKSTTIPLHVNVPSFGEWGFVMGVQRELSVADLKLSNDIQYRFLNQDIFNSLFYFGSDISKRDTEVNRLTDPVLHQYYKKGWKQYH